MPQDSINLIPETEVKQKKTNPYVTWFLGVGVYFVLATYALVLAVLGLRWYQESQLEKALASVSTKQQAIMQEQQFLQDYADLQKRFALVAEKVDSYQPVSQYLKLIEETIPQTITLEEFNIGGGKLSVSGYTEDYLAINQWVVDLKERDEISEATLSSVERNSEESGLSSSSGADGRITFMIEGVIE